MNILICAFFAVNTPGSAVGERPRVTPYPVPCFPARPLYARNRMTYLWAAMSDCFDAVALEYDRWYDSAEGAAIFREEFEALLLVKGRVPGRWLEVGVGTGRFAAALKVSDGVDPSGPMRELAAARGIRVESGLAENLPYRDATFDGVLVVASLCFVADAGAAIAECSRVLKDRGVFVAGIIPSSSPWGREYVRKGLAGHPVYSQARFLSIEETVRLAAGAGMLLRDAASALLWPPADSGEHDCRVARGARPEAGFVALRFEKRPV
jgi:ubiquinone/menaquinone biosynthesis C-methylase UbiE